MADVFSSYHENLFQWIWAEAEFNCSGLKTECGKSLSILDFGSLNHGAGPDFLQARLMIDGMEWFGSVEIHKLSVQWYRHKHHLDSNFNNVILHVIYEDNLEQPVVTEAGSKIFTLSLKNRLHKTLQNLLEIKDSKQLPCGGKVSYISQRAFEKQVNIAHNNYFEYKVKEMLSSYPADLPLSSAWKWSLISRLFSTLGIPANRDPMLELSYKLRKVNANPLSLQEFVQAAEVLAFETASLDWVNSGMRPASRPVVRVQQAAALCYAILQTPLEAFMKSPESSWRELSSLVPANYQAGKSRKRLLFYTNYLPALYVLGELLFHTSLKNSAKQQWMEGWQLVPGEIKKPFQNAGFSLVESGGKLGLAHQLKRFCNERNCHRCEVFKSAIRS